MNLVSGGSVGNSLQASNSSTLSLFGIGLIAPLVNADASGFSRYSLSGTLPDSILLVNKYLFVENGSRVRFTLNNTPAAVPELGSVALLVGLTTVSASLLRKRRARK